METVLAVSLLRGAGQAQSRGFLLVVLNAGIGHGFQVVVISHLSTALNSLRDLIAWSRFVENAILNYHS